MQNETSCRCAVLMLVAGLLLSSHHAALALDAKQCRPGAATSPISDDDLMKCMGLRTQCANGADAACKALGMTREQAGPPGPMHLGDQPKTTAPSLSAKPEVQPMARSDLAPGVRRTFDVMQTAEIDLSHRFSLGRLISASPTLAEQTRSIEGPLFARPENQATYRLFANSDDAAQFISTAMKGDNKSWLPPTPYRHAVVGERIADFHDSNVLCMTTQEPGSLEGYDWVRCFAQAGNVVAIPTIVYPHLDNSSQPSKVYGREAAQIGTDMLRIFTGATSLR